MKQAYDLTSDQHFRKEELQHVRGVLLSNGYPTGILRKCKVQKYKEKDDSEEDENKPLSTAKIPYIKGLSEEIRRILGN